MKQQLALWIDPAHVQIIRAAVYRFRALIAKRWRVKNIFLVGDAAHQTPPFYGQGMCHGIRDAAQLMWKLRLVAQGLASADVLDSYQVEREPHVREIIAASVAAGAQVCKLDPAAAAARDAEFRRLEIERAKAPVAITDVVPPIRAGMVDPGRGGMRLPEFACLLPNGSTRRLDEVLAGRFTLLSLEDSANGLTPEIFTRWRRIDGQELTVAPPEALDAKLRDVDGSFAAWLRQQQARWVIVRPDRYVYALSADWPRLEVLLERLFEQLGHPVQSLTPLQRANS